MKVVIVGGAMMGSSIAWWLTREPGAEVTVVDPDPTYATASTSHTNSCVRQQFTTPVNIQLSQFTVEFIRDIHDWMGLEAASVRLNPFGYLYLSTQPDALRKAVEVQQAEGAGTELLDPGDLAARFPFLNLEEVELGSHNPRDEGYFDGATLFDNFRRGARAQGATYVTDRVVGLSLRDGNVTGAQLESGQTLPCDVLVNAAGPRANEVAQMAGLSIPVEPRKRYSIVFESAEPITSPFPLIIDPSGVHVRPEGNMFLAGCPPEDDGPVAPDDFDMDHDIWMEKVWPALLERIPAFDRLKVVSEWAGHYAYNTWDQNALLGPLPDCPNLYFANGFSGHGLQQAAGIGRGIAELIRHGRYTTLNLSELGVDRLTTGRKVVEHAVI